MMTRQALRAVLALIVLLTVAPAGAMAQRPAPDASNGAGEHSFAQQIRLSMVLWPGDIDATADPLWGELEYRPRLMMRRSRVSGMAEVIVRGAASARAGSGVRRQQDRHAALIRELSMAVEGPVDLVIGWQIIGWGHATEGVRPLDVFQRQDLTDRLRPEQLGVLAVTASSGGEAWDAEVIVVPTAATDRIPTDASNVWYAFPASFGDIDHSGRPGVSLSNGEVGARVNWYGRRADVSLVAAWTHDRSPSLIELRRNDGVGTLRPRPVYHPYWLIGATVVRPIGSYLLRAEALRAMYNPSLEPLVTSGLRGAAGVERRLAAGQSSRYTAILQYAFDTTASARIRQAGAAVSSPFRIYRHAATASLAASWRQAYELEVRGMRELQLGSMIASAKFTYKRNDRLSVWVAVDALLGREGTVVGRLDDADRVLGGLTLYP